MPDQTPPSLLTLTPARILILALGLLALVFIVGSLLGGLSNYQELKESVSSSSQAASQ